MALYRVKAFFMHEHEKAAATSAERAAILTETEWTDGYVMGVIDEGEIPALVDQGLVITPIEVLETPDRSPGRDPYDGSGGPATPLRGCVARDRSPA
jgi:hypothetical protein